MGWTEQVHTKKLCGNRISCTCLWNRCQYRYRNSGRGKNCEMFNSLNWFQQVTFTFKIKFTGKCFSLKSIQGISRYFPCQNSCACTYTGTCSKDKCKISRSSTISYLFRSTLMSWLMAVINLSGHSKLTCLWQPAFSPEYNESAQYL